MPPKKQHWLYNNPEELQLAVQKWDAKFAERIKDSKFESYDIRSIYRGKFKKENEK